MAASYVGGLSWWDSDVAPPGAAGNGCIASDIHWLEGPNRVVDWAKRSYILQLYKQIILARTLLFLTINT